MFCKRQQFKRKNNSDVVEENGVNSFCLHKVLQVQFGVTDECMFHHENYHIHVEVSAGPFCGLVVVDLRRLLDKLLPGINVL